MFANVQRAHVYTTQWSARGISKSFKDSEERERKDSISLHILKIGTNVLNLVYNCKNLKLVRQRKRNWIEWKRWQRVRAKAKATAWAQRVEWKNQSENHCTHHIDLTNKSAQPKRLKNRLMISKKWVTCFLAHRSATQKKHKTTTTTNKWCALHYNLIKKMKMRRDNKLFILRHQSICLHKQMREKNIERKFLELQHRSATHRTYLAAYICVYIKRKFMEPKRREKKNEINNHFELLGGKMPNRTTQNANTIAFQCALCVCVSIFIAIFHIDE